MRLTTVILIASLIQVSAATFGQRITIDRSRITLKSVFKEIRKQSGYDFYYEGGIISNSRQVDVELKNATIEEALKAVLKDLPFTYIIGEKNVTIRKKAEASFLDNLIANFQAIDVHGRILTENGRPLVGATVTIKGKKRSVKTDQNGAFYLENVGEHDKLVISYIGYRDREVDAVSDIGSLTMVIADEKLEEVMVNAGYYSVKDKERTGSISRITAKDIASQPVTNVLQALAGKVPGMTIAQTDGLPGGAFDIVIRGRNSLAQGYRPLILIDGVAFSNEKTAGSFPGANLNNSPLGVLNPNDIESIEILKDADATAIYGSRGSNGVILITTKKGKQGEAQLNVSAYTGVTKSTKDVQMLNTAQYLEMRKEAFANDNLTPTVTTAPDLLIWDQNKYTDWNKKYRRGNATASNLQLDYSGGDAYTTYRIGMNYHYETPLNAEVTKDVTGRDLYYNKAGLQLNLSHRSKNDRLKFSLNTGFNFDKSEFTGLISIITLAPNAPDPLDANGNLVWRTDGVTYNNPLADLYKTYGAKNKILVNSANFSYNIFKGLDFRFNGGYNYNLYKEIRNQPKIAYNPTTNTTSNSNFQNMEVATWQVEPMLQYVKQIGDGKLDGLAGISWSNKNTERLASNVLGYTNDNYLGTFAGGTTYQLFPDATVYKYTGFYGRLNYTYDEKYIVNLTARRDGSSRFGPGKRFSTFGAAGVAYLFSKTQFIRDQLPFLSFGKIRANYGVTGNDNIGDYKYFDTWINSNSYAYDGSGNGVIPTGLFNEDYTWEKNKKLEAAIDLGFFQDRLMVSVNYYNSRAGNQLVGYRLPSQTGFSNVLKNLDAIVVNSGWEFTISASPIKNRSIRWDVEANATTAKNKLAAFPGLDASSYNSTFVIGKPVTGIRLYPFTGLDRNTGLYTYGSTTVKTEFVNYNTPKFYGGMTNNISYKGFALSAFLQFVKQELQSYVNRVVSSIPGSLNNQPVEMLDRWRNVGDQATYMRFATGRNSTIASAYYPLTSSTAFIEDASFIRLKNVSLSYSLQQELLKRMKIKEVRIFIQGQNLATITPFKGADPESGGTGNPLIKNYSAGVQFTF